MSGGGRGQKRKNNDRGGWKGKKLSRFDEDNAEDDEPRYTTRHPGSYPLEDIKALPNYAPIDEGASQIKKKYAVCFGYLGTQYQGLQINPDCKSVEAELEKAFFLAGAIIESNFGFMQKIQWSRAARTDRGVHAVSQCCAIKLLADPDHRYEFIDKVNALLPSDIRIHTMTKVMRSFNAKNHCGKRTYHYLLPTYAVQDTAVVNDILSAAYAAQGPIVGAGYEGGFVDPATSRSLNRTSLESCYPQLKDYRITDAKLSLLREALKTYEGTRAYHNFTTGKDASEMNARRYMVSFTCSEPFVVESTGVEFVLLAVHGQSFLLNQIRKMVAFAIAVTRGEATITDLLAAFENAHVSIPLAPSLGLYLNELFFDGYNIKQQRETERDRYAAQKGGGNSGKGGDDEEGEQVRHCSFVCWNSL